MIYSFHLVLPVYNEEGRICSVLESLAPRCGLITVVDNYSTDNTLRIVKQKFPGVDIVQLHNDGSIETPEWWLSIQPFLKADFILLGSCSEYIPVKLINLFSVISSMDLADVTYVARSSMTGSVCTDWLYSRPVSIATGKLMLPKVARLLKYNAIDARLIYPHNNFRRQSLCRYINIESSDSALVIHHLRPAPSLRTATKHSSYSRLYVQFHIKGNVGLAVAEAILRIIIDSLRLFRAVLAGCLSLIGFQEYLLRIHMHLHVVVLSLAYKFRRSADL